MSKFYKYTSFCLTGKSNSIIPVVYETTGLYQKQHKTFPTETQAFEATPRKEKKFYTNKEIMDGRKRTVSEMDRIGAKPMSNGGHERTRNFVYCPSMLSGMDFIRNPRLFKGMAFNLEERQGLGINH